MFLSDILKFWISGDVLYGCQSQSGFRLIEIAEVNIMHIPEIHLW